MCLAVPAEVLNIHDNVATCRVNPGRTTIRASLSLLPQPPDPGEFLLVHAGYALRVLDRGQAEESLRLLRGEAEAPA